VARAGGRLTPINVAIPERPDAHAADASADEDEKDQADEVGAPAIIEVLLLLLFLLPPPAPRGEAAHVHGGGAMKANDARGAVFRVSLQQSAISGRKVESRRKKMREGIRPLDATCLGAPQASLMLASLLVARASAPCRSSSVTCATQWKTTSPCLDGRAAAFANEEPTTEEPTHWVVVDRVQSADDAFKSALAVGAPEATVLVGAPAAVGRLRPERALVDKLLQSIVKEEPECAMAVGHCVDSLLLAWLQHLQAQEGSTGQQQFEGLRAAAQAHTAPVLEQRGFAEIEKPDMSALGRGEPVATHYARLPAGIFAYEALLASAETIAETARYNEILEALRSQPPPTPAEEPPSSGAPFQKEDPWARPGGIF